MIKIKNVVVEKIEGSKVTFTLRFSRFLKKEAEKRGISPQKLFNKIVRDYLREVKE